jgi:hypothetical protein
MNFRWQNPQHAIVGIIVIASLVRLILAAAIGLGVDESYVTAISLPLSLSYFDHPPLHIWMVGVMSALVGTGHSAVLRLPFIVLFACTTYLVYLLGTKLFSPWAGVYAALLINLSAVFSLSTGSWILPDGPLMFFMTAAALLLADLLFFAPRYPKLWWLFTGLLVGFGLLSKYHAIFIYFGLFIYVITTKDRRKLLLDPWPYLSFAVAILVFLPVLLWNSDHQWASFVFQGSRGSVKGFYPLKMLGNIAGQAAWVLPWIWVPLVVVFAKQLWRGPACPIVKGANQIVGRAAPIEQDAAWFLCSLACGPIMIFTGLTLVGGEGLFHWQAPGYLFLFPLLGKVVAEKAAQQRGIRTWLKTSITLYLLILLILGSHTATGWLEPIIPQAFAKGDPTWEALDWRSLPTGLAKQELLDPFQKSTGNFIVASHWIDAGKIGYALGNDYAVLCLDDSPHHFAFRFQPAAFAGHDALLIGRRQNMEEAVKKYGPYFDSVEPLPPIPIMRNGRSEFDLVLYYGRNFHGNFPLPYGQ